MQSESHASAQELAPLVRNEAAQIGSMYHTGLAKTRYA
jgi:hypothetical protein